MTENDDAPHRTEVVEETAETLEVLDLKRLPRPEKMAAEAALLSDAHEVRFRERAFHPRSQVSKDEVRAAVDALAPRRVTFPEARPPPAPEPVAPTAPVEPEPPAIDPRLEKALARVVDGTLRGAESIAQESAGEVVEATWETDSGEARRGIFLINDGEARPFDDVASRIDDLPAPDVSVAPEPEPEPLAEASTDAPAEATQTPPEEGGKKRRFGFGRKKSQAADEPEASDAGTDAEPAAEEAAPKKGLAGRFRRKK